MAQDKGKDTSVTEELDDEDELDGWGPVRVRRSTAPSPPAGPISVATANADPDANPSDVDKKPLMT